jgi:hypothetical protein
MTDPTPPVLATWTPPPPVYGPYIYGYPRPKPVNALALAAMVVAMVGLGGILAYGIPAIVICPVGAILGHVARRQLKQRDETGAGMALAAVIIGWVGFALGLAVVAGLVWLIWYLASQAPTDVGY